MTWNGFDLEGSGRAAHLGSEPHPEDRVGWEAPRKLACLCDPCGDGSGKDLIFL